MPRRQLQRAGQRLPVAQAARLLQPDGQQVAREIEQLRGAQRRAQELHAGFDQLVRFVEDRHVHRRQQLGHAIGGQRIQGYIQLGAGVDKAARPGIAKTLPVKRLAQAFALARLQLPHHHDQAPATIPLGWFCSINLPRGFFKPALARGCEHVVGAPPNGLGLQPLVFDQSEHRGAHQPLVDVQRLQQLDQAAQPHPPATGQDGIAKNGGDERAGLYAAFLAKALQKGLNGL